MNKKLLTSIVTACAALALPGSALAAPKVDGEFAVSDQPKQLTQGPDGNIWAAVGGKVARITPAGGVTEFDPAGIGTPKGITAGPDGNLWVTQSGGVAKFSPADPNSAQGFSIAYIGQPQAITAGPDGNLWTASGDEVVKIPPANPATAGHKKVTGLDARGIASSGGRLWVVNRTGKAIVSVTPDFGTITPHPVTAGPQEVAGGPNGQVAYTDPGQNPHEVGRLTQGAAALKSFAPNTDAFGITYAKSDGAYWFAEFIGDKVGRLTTDGKVSHVGPFSKNSRPRWITAGPNNTLWVALEGNNKIGRVTGVTPPPAAGKPGGAVKGDRTAPAVSRLSARRAKVRFRLSEKAGVRITIKRKGRKAKVIRRKAKKGRNAVAFRRLARGRYRVSVIAKDTAGNKSRARSVRLKVKR
jgi:streptogramin lyase